MPGHPAYYGRRAAELRREAIEERRKPIGRRDMMRAFRLDEQARELRGIRDRLIEHARANRERKRAGRPTLPFGVDE